MSADLFKTDDGTKINPRHIRGFVIWMLRDFLGNQGTVNIHYLDDLDDAYALSIKFNSHDMVLAMEAVKRPTKQAHADLTDENQRLREVILKLQAKMQEKDQEELRKAGKATENLIQNLQGKEEKITHETDAERTYRTGFEPQVVQEPDIPVVQEPDVQEPDIPF